MTLPALAGWGLSLSLLLLNALVRVTGLFGRPLQLPATCTVLVSTENTGTTVN